MRTTDPSGRRRRYSFCQPPPRGARGDGWPPAASAQAARSSGCTAAAQSASVARARALGASQQILDGAEPAQRARLRIGFVEEIPSRGQGQEHPLPEPADLAGRFADAGDLEIEAHPGPDAAARVPRGHAAAEHMAVAVRRGRSAGIPAPRRGPPGGTGPTPLPPRGTGPPPGGPTIPAPGPFPGGCRRAPGRPGSTRACGPLRRRPKGRRGAGASRMSRQPAGPGKSPEKGRSASMAKAPPSGALEKYRFGETGREKFRGGAQLRLLA